MRRHTGPISTAVGRLATEAEHDWRDDARCAGLPPEWFESREGYRHNLRALAFCDVCPVRRDCRDFMLDTPGAKAPASVIAGGWVWGKDGIVLHTHRDDIADMATIRAAAHLRARQRRAAAAWRKRHPGRVAA